MTPTPAKPVSRLDQIVSFLDAGSVWASELAPAGTPPQVISTIADKLLKVALASIRAHEAITGEPLDLDKLKEIQHV